MMTGFTERTSSYEIGDYLLTQIALGINKGKWSRMLKPGFWTLPMSVRDEEGAISKVSLSGKEGLPKGFNDISGDD